MTPADETIPTCPPGTLHSPLMVAGKPIERDAPQTGPSIDQFKPWLEITRPGGLLNPRPRDPRNACTPGHEELT